MYSSTTHSLQIPRHHTWKTNVGSLSINPESSASLRSAGLSHALPPQPPCLLSPGGSPSGKPQTAPSAPIGNLPCLPPDCCPANDKVPAAHTAQRPTKSPWRCPIQRPGLSLSAGCILRGHWVNRERERSIGCKGLC